MRKINIRVGFLCLSLAFIIGVFVTPVVRAQWQRLHKAECIDVDTGHVCIIWDELEKTNCYIYRTTSLWGMTNGALAGGISCIKE